MDTVHISCDWGLRRDGDRLLFRTKGGRIIYRSEGRVFPFELELAVTGFFIDCPRELAALAAKEREAIIKGLQQWLAEVGYIPKPVESIDYSEEEALCLIAGCTSRRLKGRYLCRTHFGSSFADAPGAVTLHIVPIVEAV